MRTMEDTYIKAYRKLLKWRWADNSNMLALWIRLLLIANYEDKGWHNITIHRGQIVTSVAKLSAESGLSKQQIRTCLERLKETGEITIESTNKYTIITICNYDDYQAKDNECQQTNNNQITNEQQTNNNQITTTKEYKERKEREEEIEKENIVKEKEIKRFTPPTIEDVKDYVLSIRSQINVEDFYNYYEATEWKVQGKPMKNWKLVVQTWTKKDRTERPWLYGQYDDKNTQQGELWQS